MSATEVVFHEDFPCCAAAEAFSNYKSEECSSGYRPCSSVIAPWREMTLAMV